MILRIAVRLSHPAPMDLVLRKRLSLNVYKRQSFTDRIKRRIVRSDVITHCGVTYEVVSNVPKASEELEDRESLAQLAASGEDSSLCDGETYIGMFFIGLLCFLRFYIFFYFLFNVEFKFILVYENLEKV